MPDLASGGIDFDAWTGQNDVATGTLDWACREPQQYLSSPTSEYAAPPDPTWSLAAPLIERSDGHLEIKGAIYRKGNDELVVSTQPLDCSGSASWEEEVNLLLKNDGTRGRLSGLLVEGVDTDEVSRPAKVKLGKKAGETIAANLDGSFQLGPYAVNLEGKASLLACD